MQNTRTWMILCLLAAWVVLLRLPSLDEPLDNDSGSFAYHARLILRGEPLYSTHHPNHHMPGASYTYAMAFVLFGDQQFAPKWLLLPWTIVISWVLYFLGRWVSSERTGILAAAFFCLGTSQVMLKGMTAEPELFANLPITLSVTLSIKLLSKRSRSWQWLWVGILSGVAVVYKAVYIAPIATAGLAILADLFENRRSAGEIRKFLERGAWLAVGFAIPLLVMGFYFGWLGLLDRVLLIFSLGMKYMREFSVHVQPLPLPPLVGFPIFLMAFNNLALLVIGLVGSLRLVRKKVKLDPPDLAVRIALLSWLLFSFIQAGINSVGFAHYVLLVIPGLAFFAGLEIDTLYRQRAERASKQSAVFLAGCMAALILANSIWTNYSIYVHDISYRLGRETYEQSLANRPGVGKIYLTIAPVAEYIRTHTAPEDYVYYWGVDAQFYYLADRRCALEFIWPYYATSSDHLENVFAPETKYIILADPVEQPRPAWLLEGMGQNYRYETTIQGIEIYRRGSAGASP